MTEKILQYFDINGFQHDLLKWYHQNKRDLPWRKDQDPYKIWVSEIMLQQTRVDTVIPYFNRFMLQFPTIYDLAKADPQIVLKAWEGLGYYSRARNLHEAVREVVSAYDGVVPSNPDELGSLKGVGPYTRGAILSIAYNQPEPAVDGNVMRVISRVLKIKDNITQHRVRKMFETYIRKMISDVDPASFNQGIMELGALICTPKSPGCLICPIQKYCQAFADGIEKDLPIKSKAKKQKTIPYVVLLIKDERNQVAIEKRPSNGLLANLWQFPMVPIDEIGMSHVENWIRGEYGLSVLLKEKRGKLKHTFSHIIWELEVFEATVVDICDNERLIFVDESKLRDFPFPVSHLNMMKYLA